MKRLYHHIGTQIPGAFWIPQQTSPPEQISDGRLKSHPLICRILWVDIDHAVQRKQQAVKGPIHLRFISGQKIDMLSYGMRDRLNVIQANIRGSIDNRTMCSWSPAVYRNLEPAHQMTDAQSRIYQRMQKCTSIQARERLTSFHSIGTLCFLSPPARPLSCALTHGMAASRTYLFLFDNALSYTFPPCLSHQKRIQRSLIAAVFKESSP